MKTKLRLIKNIPRTHYAMWAELSDVDFGKDKAYSDGAFINVLYPMDFWFYLKNVWSFFCYNIHCHTHIRVTTPNKRKTAELLEKIKTTPYNYIYDRSEVIDSE